MEPVQFGLSQSLIGPDELLGIDPPSFFNSASSDCEPLLADRVHNATAYAFQTPISSSTLQTANVPLPLLPLPSQENGSQVELSQLNSYLFYLYLCLLYGLKIEKSLGKVLALLSNKARHYNCSSIDALGELFLSKGGTINKEKAFLLFLIGTLGGNPISMFKTARLFLTGTGTNKNDQKAFELFLKAAQAGYAPANAYVASCYQSRIGVEKDLQKGFECFAKGASEGDPLAMNNLACCYYNGSGVTKNISQAVEWFIKSSNLRNPAAMCTLGYCYQEGIGVAQDMKKAKELYLKASYSPYPPAMRLLGLWHLYPSALPCNLEIRHRTAVEWLTKGAEAHDPYSMHTLAFCFMHGLGVARDERKASELFTNAAFIDLQTPSQLVPGVSHLLPELCYPCNGKPAVPFPEYICPDPVKILILPRPCENPPEVRSSTSL